MGRQREVHEGWEGVWRLVSISQLRLIFILLLLCPWILEVAVTCYFPGSYGKGCHEAVRVLLLTEAAGKGRDVPKKLQSTSFWGVNCEF